MNIRDVKVALLHTRSERKLIQDTRRIVWGDRIQENGSAIHGGVAAATATRYFRPSTPIRDATVGDTEHDRAGEAGYRTVSNGVHLPGGIGPMSSGSEQQRDGRNRQTPRKSPAHLRHDFVPML